MLPGKIVLMRAAKHVCLDLQFTHTFHLVQFNPNSRLGRICSKSFRNWASNADSKALKHGKSNRSERDPGICVFTPNDFEVGGAYTCFGKLEPIREELLVLTL